jgi:hypothetical protein
MAMISFGSCNILDKQSSHFNRKCGNKYNPAFGPDDQARYQVIMKMLKKINLDIIFLQEAEFSQQDIKELSELFYVCQSSKLCTLVNKGNKKISNFTVCRLPGDENSRFQISDVSFDDGSLFGKMIYLINIHLPSRGAGFQVEQINKYLNTISSQAYVIIAGDTNSENTIDFHSKYQYTAWLDQYTQPYTSFSLWNCQAKGVITKKPMPYKKLDHIYTGTNIALRDNIVYVINNLKDAALDPGVRDFDTTQPPFCGPRGPPDNQGCDDVVLFQSLHEKNPDAWFSDHAFLVARFELLNRQQTKKTQIGGIYMEKYYKYKTDYNNIKFS